MNNEPVTWTACLDCGKRVTADSIHTCSPQKGTREMNNEPVAWMFQGAFDISTYVSFEKPNSDIYPNPTPLYTHPVKELTEQIRKLETALQGWEIGFERMGYERLLKDKDEYIAKLLKESVKELTDEEIIAEAEKQDWLGLKSESEWQPEIDFAKAILKKAQEK